MNQSYRRMNRIRFLALGISALLATPVFTGAWAAIPSNTAGPASPADTSDTPDLPDFSQYSEDQLFPRYSELQSSVAFWKQVFSKYSDNQSVVHSALYPYKVLRVLDFRSEAARMDKRSFARYRANAEKKARKDFEHLIRSIDSKYAHPEQMNAEEQRIYRVFADVDGNPFHDMRGTIRTQRGLRERTEKALKVSSRYLPYMEKVFSGYKLPTELTRLPLVESSFNLNAYSKSGASGVWQFIPSTARAYMRLNEVVDDRRDPWTSTDAAARHLMDDYATLGDWPLAITAYNQGRNGIRRDLDKIKGDSLVDLIDRTSSRRFGFAGRNYYAEFLAAVDVERQWQRQEDPADTHPIEFDVVETQHYVPYETLRRLCGADDEVFQRLNPAYRPEVIAGKLYVPPHHLIRVPAGSASDFEVAYSKLGSHQLFDKQRVYFLLHKVRRGDTLGGLAQQYRTHVSAIRGANHLRGNTIRIGQVLKIPPHEELRPGPITVAVGESEPSLTREQREASMRESTRTHRVRKGDTLISIAKRYSVSVASLKLANDLDGSMIRSGQKLTIPASTAHYQTHTVRSGQTLISIAKRYGVSVQDLRNANSLHGTSLIKAGQKLRVPAI